MLKKFKEKNKKRRKIIIFTFFCIFLIAGVMYQSFALFEVNEQFNVVSGSLGNPGDISFAFYIKDEIALEAPKKDSELALDEKSSCTNGVNISWNVDSWNANLDYSSYKHENTSKVKCNLYFRNATFSDYVTSCGQNDISAAECMKKYAKVDTVNLAYDETPDNNLRYVGADPNNYVWFNDELWRIIGIMNKVKDAGGNLASRIKLIRNEPIGRYSWDNKPKGTGSSSSEYGSNDWSDSRLQSVLNEGPYWNRINGQCPQGKENKTVPCDFSNTGLDLESKNKISAVIWNLGGARNFQTESNGLSQHWYIYERGSDVYTNRPSTWTGNVGLMYVSDYGYATSGGENTNRKTCLEKPLWNWGIQEIEDCKRNSWLYNDTMNQWTLSVFAFDYTDVALVGSPGNVAGISTFGAYASLAVSPVVYLNKDIRIISGEGTKTVPYELSDFLR